MTVGLPFTFRFAAHLAFAPWKDTSPDCGTLQLYSVKVCLAPSSIISTSCVHKKNKKAYIVLIMKLFIVLFHAHKHTLKIY